MRHVIALFFPGRHAPVHQADQNVAGDLAGWDAGDLQVLIDEGRRQLDRQNEDLERIRGRSQVLLVLGLALGGSAGSLLGKVRAADHQALWALWGLGVALIALSIFGAAATAVVRADIDMIHAAVLSRRSAPVVPRLAADYAESAMAGENELATRLINLRLSVALLLVGALFILGSWAWADSSGNHATPRASTRCVYAAPPPRWGSRPGEASRAGPAQVRADRRRTRSLAGRPARCARHHQTPLGRDPAA